jgi:hypothetical protein
MENPKLTELQLKWFSFRPTLPLAYFEEDPVTKAVIYIPNRGIFTSRLNPYNNTEAKEKSIVKWQLILLGYQPNDAAQTCGFCNLYIAEGCRDCPIDLLGYSQCTNDAFTKYKRGKNNQRRMDAAQEELTFLESLEVTA